MPDALLDVLDDVVETGGPLGVSIVDALAHVGSSLTVGQMRQESALQIADGLPALEAREAALGLELEDANDSFLVPAGNEEALGDEVGEFVEHGAGAIATGV